MDKTIYALGFFDGVHIGHQALLNICRSLAIQNGCRAGAVTFASHPDALVRGSPPVLINTPADRRRLLLRQLDTVLTLPFDRHMCATPWEEFLDRLRRENGAAGFACGDDFRFGDRGAGNAALLGEYCRNAGLPWAVAPEQTLDGVRVSSTCIRQLLEAGQMERANAFLGHPHILTGPVVSGAGLGHTLGIPTANVRMDAGLAAPRLGVYACQAVLEGKRYCAVTNVGARPTVGGSGVRVESWLLDFSGDLYGREITLEFYKFLRPERRFPSLNALQAAVRANAEETRAFFAEAALPP